MKALTQFTNVDKAALLHQLFPGEIPALLDFITGMCQAIQENEERNRAAWDDGFMSFDFWLRLLNESEALIAKKSQAMIKSRLVFSEQLFSGYTALYVNHCISVYTRVKVHPNPKFTLAVELLFNP
jgi:hypothetical protein